MDTNTILGAGMIATGAYVLYKANERQNALGGVLEKREVALGALEQLNKNNPAAHRSALEQIHAASGELSPIRDDFPGTALKVENYAYMAVGATAMIAGACILYAVFSDD